MLTLRNLNRHVGNHHIITDVDLDIHQGQAIGLVWPNGCGKTSLINVINGFNIPNSWSIIFDGKHITKMSVEERALLWIWRVFQSFGVFKTLTLEENLALAFVHKLTRRQKRWTIGMLPSAIKEQIADILHELDLYDKRKNLASSLSGGQMRLLEIARLFLQDTKLYLLDEPTAGVSPKLKGKVIKLLQKIIAQQKTLIIVEHDFWFLGEFVDQIYVMNEGSIYTHGTYDQIKNDPKVKEIYFWK
jgi:ABC-type branched-subunit amino acid transport system ATPase component